MLNALFHGVSSGGSGAAAGAVGGLNVKADFARGVRASAGLVGGMQLVAVLLMRTRYPKERNNRQDGEDRNDGKSLKGRVNEVKKMFELVRRFAADWPYALFCLG